MHGVVERCPEHGLVLGPDGLCVLCRTRAERALSRRVWSGLGAVVVVTCAAASAAWAWQDARAREREQMASMVAATAVHPWLELPAAPIPTQPPVAQGTRRFHFPQGEPAQEQQAMPIAAAPAPEAGPDPSLERNKRVQEAMKDVSVTIYTADWCEACQAAKQWLRENSIRYDDRNIESTASARAELRRLNPRGSLPTLQIDGAVLTGFSAGSLRSAIRRAAEARVARGEN
jgi:glutaredoxin